MIDILYGEGEMKYEDMMKAHGIMFHHFHDCKKHLPQQGSITADELADIITYYKKEYNVLSAKDWYGKAQKNKLSKRDVCLTFDDSLRCQFDIALPVLERFDLTAFWFVYTLPMDNHIGKLELYRYYRHKEFENINEFYNTFYHTIQHSEFKKVVNDRLKSFKSDKFFSNFSFYSEADKMFRYIRDYILGELNYEKIMDTMISQSNINLRNLLPLLYMDKNCLRILKKKCHVIGLHSHTHPVDFKKLNKKRQEVEYTINYNRLKSIIKDEIFTMSHPCNSYNKNTLAILRNLKIKIGFRADMALSKYSQLEFPRLDHAYLICQTRK